MSTFYEKCLLSVDLNSQTGTSNSGRRSEDEAFKVNEGAVRRGPDGAEPAPPAPNKRHVYSRFCVVT